MAWLGRRSGAGNSPRVLVLALPAGTRRGHTRRGPRGDPGQGTPRAPQLRTCSSSVQLLGGRREGGREKPDFWSQRRGGEVGGSWRKSRWGCRGWEADAAAHGSRNPCPDPLAQRDPALLGGTGGQGRTGGSHLGGNAAKTQRGRRSCEKGPQGRELPLCWAKGPWNGGVQGARRSGGSVGGSATQDREQRATQSSDRAGARTRAGPAALGRDRQPLAGSVSWLPWKGRAELTADPQGCSALAQLPRSGTQGAATAKRRLQVKPCAPSTSPAPPGHRAGGPWRSPAHVPHALGSSCAFLHPCKCGFSLAQPQSGQRCPP